MSSNTSPIRLSGCSRFVAKPRKAYFTILLREAWSAMLAVLLLSLILLVQGCGGGGGSESLIPPDPGQDTGDVTVSITDAEGDFLRYAVDVLSIRMLKANGDVVETLPLTTRIDFTELTNLTEFLTTATVPAGVYQSVEMTLDYNTAEILVQDVNGDPVAASVVDSKGETISTLTVRVDLPNTDTVRIAPGIPAHVSLDFALDASNEVDLNQSPPLVTVQPFLLVMPEWERNRSHRLRGLLAGVDEAASSITLKVRPFRHFTGEFGRFTFFTSADSQFEVDGAAFTGAEGLRAMASLAQGTPVVAAGQITDVGFVAVTVLAGSSVPWSNVDAVKGVVTARTGDTLTVKGARIEFRDGTEVYHDTFRVLLGADTVITAVTLDSEDLDNSAVSVGQRILATGELTSADTLDATAGRVRMKMNQLAAEVVQADPLAVNLFFLNARKPQVYDFSGTGMSPAQDADPAFYEIDSATLPLSGIARNDLVKIRGLVNAFGMAPADFNAHTVINVATDDRAAVLRVSWLQTGGTDMPFSNLANERIDVDLSAARFVLKLRGIPVAFSKPDDGVALLPAATGRGVYAVTLRGGGEIHIFRDFAALVTELGGQLDAGNLLNRISAQGRYNTATKELSARRLSFEFIKPVAIQ